MLKIIKISTVTALCALLVCVIILKTPLAKYPVSFFLSKALGMDVTLKSCTLLLPGNLAIKGAQIKNRTGLRCAIKEGLIKYNVLGILKNNTALDISLKNVNFSNAESKVIKGIIELFYITPIGLFEFNTVEGIVYIKPKELIIKDLKAKGSDVTFFANGTTKNDNQISYTVKLILSDNITSKIPEEIRSIFFKREQQYSIVELYINGNLKKPSIQFSTPLFKLSIK
ncbi:MAG: hypothetical protein JW946_01100 [Candidatus Omnitrophica bacterium]|nr:hypothetical protein [Candidatus Omnitrophota bacterium]